MLSVPFPVPGKNLQEHAKQYPGVKFLKRVWKVNLNLI